MTPPAVAAYVEEAFGLAGSAVSVHVIDDQTLIGRDYPMMAAVNRAANTVSRHQARLIYLEYTGEAPIDETLMFVGKVRTGSAN